MEDKCRPSGDSHNFIKPEQVTLMVQRLKEEHEALKGKVTVLYSKAREFNENLDVGMAWILLLPLWEEVQALQQELDEHAKWEERELFPTLTQYFNLHTRPTIMPSFWVMEKEHELAMQFIQPFIDVLKEISYEENPAIPYDLQTLAQIKLAAVDLFQACLILQEHFKIEEDLIYPLANELRR